LTPRRLRQLAEGGHIPKAVRGRYPLASTVRGYLNFLRERVERAGNDSPGADLARSKEREIRLRVRQREAELIDAEDVERFHAFSADIYRSELSKVGAEVSRDPIIAGQINAALA